MPRFDPNLVQVRWGSDLVTGFASGTYIDVQYTTPEESTPQVNFGTLIEVVNTDVSGTVTCTLKPDSPFLRIYQQRANAAKIPGANLQKPLVVTDLNGGIRRPVVYVHDRLLLCVAMRKLQSENV